MCKGTTAKRAMGLSVRSRFRGPQEPASTLLDTRYIEASVASRSLVSPSQELGVEQRGLLIGLRRAGRAAVAQTMFQMRERMLLMVMKSLRNVDFF